MMFSRVILAIPCISTLFLLLANNTPLQYISTYIYICLYLYRSINIDIDIVDGLLGCFHILTIMSNAAVNLHVQIDVDICF